MIELEAAFVSKLNATTAINALIAGRVAPVQMPERLARPNVIYQRLSSRRIVANDGPCGLARSLLQVTVYADTYAGAKTLAKLIRETFNGFAGTIGDLPIQSMILDDERDAPAAPTTGQSAVIAGIVLTFSVAHRE